MTVITVMLLLSMWLCRDTWRGSGHGMWHVHKDLVKMSPSLCPSSDRWSDAVHWWDTQLNEHHYLWSANPTGFYTECLITV